MPFKNLNEFQMFAIAGSFAGLCGWLSYPAEGTGRKGFHVAEFLLHGAISAVCGLISYEIFVYESLPPQLCGALSGLAGWARDARSEDHRSCHNKAPGRI